MNYKLVIFDFDGTLANSLPFFMGIVNQVADRYRFKHIETHELDTLRGYSARKVMNHLGIPLWKLPLIARHLRTLTRKHGHTITLFEGVDDMLRSLSSSEIRLAIVSSNSEDVIRAVLGPDTASLIKYYECSVSLFGKSKRFQRILKRSGMLPHEAFSIGDEIRDVEASNKAGIAFGAVAWGYTNATAFQPYAPVELFQHVSDITFAVV